MSRPRYRRSGNPGEPDAGRTQDHDKSAAPVVLPHVLVRVDDDGTLAVTVDGEPVAVKGVVDWLPGEQVAAGGGHH